MSDILSSEQRRLLDTSIQKARVVAEEAAAAALTTLAVAQTHRPGYLNDEQNELRKALRSKARQLGDTTTVAGAPLTNLEREVAYEQWHRLLFARFLEVNGLLRYPEDRTVAVTLDDCAELAPELGEPDGWSVAARFASEILPGVFRLDDPAVRVRFATEHRLALEQILQDLPEEVFRAEDSLGWVYQFWQTAEKKRVNESGVKIGGADLSPVTQLFTENYMVRFLLENSLGAWWAARHPDSPLIESWKYLRRLEDGTPAAGTFPEWPTTAAEVTVMDPCCGSGHFLVAMFGMLWRMRAEEEGLAPAEAQDAVLRDNLFGLELDPRCTQIATFNVALEAWKQGGFREIPAPRVACSGVPVRGTRADWEARAGDSTELRSALTRLHSLFRNADTLGSLISPRPADLGDALFGRDLTVGESWEKIRAALLESIDAEQDDAQVLGQATNDVVHAAALLSRTYTLVATNPPYLQRQSMTPSLVAYVDAHHPLARADISTAFIERGLDFLVHGGSLAVVSPQNWALVQSYTKFRQSILRGHSVSAMARLGSGAFRQITGEVVKVTLTVVAKSQPRAGHVIAGVMAQSSRTPDEKARHLRNGTLESPTQSSQTRNPDSRITLSSIDPTMLLEGIASGLNGTTTGDYARFGRCFWEVLEFEKWAFQQSTVSRTQPYGGREHVVSWREVEHDPGATVRGKAALGKHGVAVSQMSMLPASLYTGERFDNNTAVILPRNPQDLPAIWAYVSSDEYGKDVREIDDTLKVTNATVVKVAFDRDRWTRVAEAAGPLPVPHSDDPTQWLFKGEIPTSTHPLQVAVARLLGYRWPDQPADALDAHADADGIVALQSLPGEPDAATRLRALLADAYGDQWSSTLERRLVVEAGGKSGRLEDWLRDTFFTQHVKTFDNRPFIWHITDGAKDGFHALVNYHRLDQATLEKLTWTTLGHWIERQTQEDAAGRAGADTRLAKAKDLRAKLQLILDGEAPYDVFVRWKELREQPIGWHPDLDDGVRLNIRPFVTAGVLRSKVNVHWKKDRGINPDGTERLNDLHPTLAERRAVREAHEAGRS